MNLLERFAGIRALYGEEGFLRLQRACVLVAGVGGVGSWLTEALCRSAVGSLILIDPDCIELTNTNRQLHTTSKTLGQSKAQVLAARLKEINPDLKIEVRQETLTKENIPTLLADCPPYAADAIDDIGAKCALINFLHQRGCCFITAGGAAGRFDPTKIAIDDIACAHGNELMKHVRDILRREYNFPKGGRRLGVVCAYSAESSRRTPPDAAPGLPALGASMPVTAGTGLAMASWLLTSIALPQTPQQRSAEL